MRRVLVGALTVALAACAASAPPTATNTPDFQGLSGLETSKPSTDVAAGLTDSAPDALVANLDAFSELLGDAGSTAELPGDASSVEAAAGEVDDAVADDSEAEAETVKAETEPSDAEPVDTEPGDADGSGGDDFAGAELVDIELPVVDVTVADSNPADSAADTWLAPIGGQPGSGCFGKDGTVTCSPDGKYRVECNNGAWTALQHCGFGLCAASLSPGGAVATVCGVPPTKNLAVNDACARYSKCFGGPGHETCVRGVLSTSNFTAGLPTAKAVAVADLAFTGIASNLACAAAATTCPALAECLYFFAQPKCQGASAGCAGDVAWQCLAGAALAVHCKGLNMACLAGGGTAMCTASEPCSAAGPATCKDGVASKCSTLADGKTWLEKSDCAAAAGSCQQGAGSIAAACGGQAETPCAAKDFVASCQDGAALTCANGDTVKTPCGPGLSCAVENQFALFEKACPEGQGCTVALCTEGGSCSAKAKCNGSEVWFCEGKQPAAYDCKAKGMSCAMGPTGPRCQ